MKLMELLAPWSNTVLPDCDVLGLCNDSRKICPGDLFFAYKGAAFDGRLYIADAVRAGAKAVVYSPENSTISLPDSVPCVAIPQIGDKLAEIARRFYQTPHNAFSVTGVTGTNGKTTIAYQLAQAFDLLNQRASYVGTIGQGSVQALQPLANTTPDALCLQRLMYEYWQAGVAHVCMEVSSHALAQGRVAGIDFTQAIFTNLTHEHLDYHHTMEEYAAAKAALFAMPTLQWAIINHDDAYCAAMQAKVVRPCETLTYGLQEGADVRALLWQTNIAGTQLEIASPWGMHSVRVNLVGAFNVYNSLAVFASLLAQGVAASEAVRVMSLLQASPGRMEVISANPCVIVDYAHTPDALENALSTLSQLKQGRLFVVFGCGGDRDRAKRPMMGRIASQYADGILLTSDNPRSEDPLAILQEIASGVASNNNLWSIVDRKEAIHQALAMAEPKDIVLIAGKGHETYQQIGKERFDFSDKAVVQSLLKGG